VGVPSLVPHARAQVIVVGGGLAGLVAAYAVEKRGLSTYVLEADSTWGGRVATAEYPEGLYAEYGLQELWADNPLLDLARELGVALDDSPAMPYSSVVIDGKLYPYFRTAKEDLFDRLLTAREKARLVGWLEQAQSLRLLALQDGLRNPRVSRLQGMSFAAWVQSANLPHNAAELVRLHLECELASSWQSFSALSGLLEFGMFLGEGQLAYHIRGGNSRLVEALARSLRGEQQLSAQVTHIERWQDDAGRRGVRVTYLRNHRSTVIEGDRVILAVPFWRLHQIEITPPLSAEKWQAVRTLGRGQYTVVHLLIDRDAEPLWLLDGKSPMAVLTDGPLGVVYGFSEEPPASSPVGVFSLLVHGNAAAAFHMIPREVRLREIDEHLEQLWPGLSQYIRGRYVYTYHPAALPVWPPGRSPLDELAEALRTPENGLFLAGDYLYGGHSDGAARSGLHAAEQVSADLSAAPNPAPRPTPRP
jgi:monoamine oxidase